MTPIINLPDRLILQDGGRIRLDIDSGMDTCTRIYVSPIKATTAAKANAMVGNALSVAYPNLLCADYEILEGKVTDEVHARFVGWIGTNREPRALNDVSITTVTLLGVPQGSTSGAEESISVSYYAPQTQWLWLEGYRPEWVDDASFGWVHTILSSGSLVVSPFQTDPYTLNTDLDYVDAIQTVDFHTEQHGDFWRCSATNRFVLQQAP